jgi:hypothetical protein
MRVKKLAGAVPQKGQTITALEGVDLEGNEAVVLSAKVLPAEDSRLVILFFPALGSVKEYRVPLASTVTVKEETDYTIPNSSVDELRLKSPERSQLPIRNNIPDSFYPTDPNYPSTITDVLWRPTMRRTPYPRFYNYQDPRKEKVMRRRNRNRPHFDNRRVQGQRKPRRKHAYYPYGPATPDTDTDRPRRYNFPTRRSVDGNPSFPPPDPRVFDPDLVTPELIKRAVAFWQGYQDKRHKVLSGIPGLGSRTGLPLEKWAVIFQKEHTLSTPAMDQLWHYMMGIDWVTASVYRNWQDLLEANELNQVRTPRYYTETEEELQVEASTKIHPRMAATVHRANLRRLAKAAGLRPDDFLAFFVEKLMQANDGVGNIDNLMEELVTSDEAVADGKLMQRYLVDLRERFEDLKNHVLGLLAHFETSSVSEPVEEA